MANNRATFVVDVLTKGLKQAREGVANIGNSIRDTTTAHRQANKAASDHYNTQAKGVIGTANSSKSFSKLAETMNQSNGLVGTYATLAANIFAVTAAFSALRNAAQVQQVLEGLNASGARLGLNLSLAADGVKTLSGNLLSAEQAMRSTAQVVAAGFDTKELNQLTLVAKDVSFALGRNMQDSMDRLTRGVVKLEPELLDELGIMTKIGESNAKYAQELGKTESQLTSFEKRQGFLNAVLAEADLKFGGLSESAGNTTAFDQLAAKFSDLTKSIFNFINIAAIPLAGIFGQSSTALFGGMLLLASTISRQLLPGLSNISGKAAAAATEFKDLAIQNTAFTKGTKELSPSFDKLFNKMKEGTITTKQFTAARKDLNSELRDAQALKVLFGKGTDEYKESNRDIRRINETKTALKELENAQKRVASKELAANAIGNASGGSIFLGMDQLKQSITDYGATIDQNGKKTTAFSKTVFAVGNSVQFAAGAFLRFLPYIGMFTVAIGLAVTAIGWFQSAEGKALNKALKDLDAVVKSSTVSMKEFARASQSTANGAKVQQQQYTIVSNSVREIAEKYNEATAALKAYNNAQGEQGKKSAKGIFGNSVYSGSDLEGIFEGIENFQNKITKWESGIDAKSIFQGFNNTAIEETAELTAYMALYESEVPLIAENARKALKGKTIPELIAGADNNSAEVLRILGEAITSTNEKLINLGPAAEAVSEAFKNAEIAASDFLTKFVKTTSYDKMNDSLYEITSTLTNLRIEMSRAGEDSTEFLRTLQNIGPNQAKFLSEQSRNIVSGGGAAAALLLDVQKKQEKYADTEFGQAGGFDEAEKKARGLLKLYQDRAIIVEMELQNLSQQLVKLRAMEILTKSQLELERARMEAIASIYENTGAGLRAQMADQEKLRDLQLQQLDAQREFVKNLGSSVIITPQQRADYEFVRTHMKDVAYMADLSSKVGDEGAQQAAVVARRQLETYNEVAGKLRSIEESQINLQGIDTERLIIAEQRLTYAQQEAAVAEREAVAKNKVLKAEQELGERLISHRLIQRDITQMLSGNPKTILDEVYALQLSNAQKRKGYDLTVQGAREELKARIQTAKAVQSRADGDAQRNEAAASQIANLEVELGLLNARYEADKTSLDLEERREILSKANFEARVEGLQWQQDSLSLLEKELTLRQDILDSAEEVYKFRTDQSIQNRGLAKDAEHDRAEEIRAARIRLETTLEEVSVRGTMIDLEFALIEGQREILKEELSARRQLLAMNQEIASNDPRLLMLDAAINNLNTFNTDAAKNLAKKALQGTVNAARAELEGLINPRSAMAGPVNRMISFLDGVSKRVNETTAAQVALQTNTKDIAEVSIVTRFADKVSGDFQAALEPIEPVMNTVVSELQKVVSALEQLVANVPNSMNPGSLEVGSMSIQEAEKIAREAGLRITERVGIDSGGHKGAGHRQGRAFDASIAGGNQDSSNPRYRAQMDALADKFVKQGLVVLWNGQRLSAQGNSAIKAGEHMHRDHMHVEQVRVAAIKAIEKIPVQVASAASNDNEPVIVNASKTRLNVPEQSMVDTTGDLAILENTAPLEKAKLNIQDYISFARGAVDQYKESLLVLGPQGALVMSISEGMLNIGSSAAIAFETMSNTSATSTDKFLAMAQVAGQALSTISSIVTASSDAKIQAIDKEIAAEQRRDGKSTESVAKIQALEKKKDAAARKSFNVQKKLMMAQAIVSTAAGVAMALGTLPPPLSFYMAGITGAMGAAQLAIIAGTSYQSTASANFDAKSMPSTLSIGKRGDGVDVAKHNSNIGGELGYLRGSRGQGTNSSNYNVIGSAYGGALPRGYGNTAYAVGEKGPEIITRETPITVTPMNDNNQSSGGTLNLNVTAFDGQSVQDMLHDQRGNLISMMREAANASGGRFMEDVNVNVYQKPNVGGAKRI